MSTVQADNSGIKMTVLIRAYRDRPVRLKVIVKDQHLRVCGNDPALSMGWPADDAYCDDPRVFETLKAAWESGDEKAITEAWKCAKRLPLT